MVQNSGMRDGLVDGFLVDGGNVAAKRQADSCLHGQLDALERAARRLEDEGLEHERREALRRALRRELGAGLVEERQVVRGVVRGRAEARRRRRAVDLRLEVELHGAGDGRRLARCRAGDGRRLDAARRLGAEARRQHRGVEVLRDARVDARRGTGTRRASEDALNALFAGCVGLARRDLRRAGFFEALHHRRRCGRERRGREENQQHLW